MIKRAPGFAEEREGERERERPPTSLSRLPGNRHRRPRPFAVKTFQNSIVLTDPYSHRIQEVPIGLSIKVETSQDSSQSVTHTNQIDYSVPLNKQSAMVSQQGYNRQNGNLTITLKNGPVDGHNVWYISPFYQGESLLWNLLTLRNLF